MRVTCRPIGSVLVLFICRVTCRPICRVLVVSSAGLLKYMFLICRVVGRSSGLIVLCNLSFYATYRPTFAHPMFTYRPMLLRIRFTSRVVGRSSGLLVLSII